MATEATGIYNNDSALYTSIVTALKQVTNADMWTVVNPLNGTTTTSDLYPFDPDDLDTKYKAVNADHVTVKRSTYARGVPTDPTFEDPYVTHAMTGQEAMMEVIAKEIMNYVVAEANVAMKARMDRLEQDFNTLSDALATAATQIAALSTQAAGVALPPAGGDIHTHTGPLLGSIGVVTPTDLSSIFTNLLTATSGPERQTNVTTTLSATNELINGYAVQIR